MKSVKKLRILARSGPEFVLLSFFLLACSKKVGDTAAASAAVQTCTADSVASSATTVANPGGSNSMAITISGFLDGSLHVNIPTATVTICTPGSNPATTPSACNTINNLLVDTGSNGLRVFKSLITRAVPTTITDNNGKTYAECIQYGDGSSQWGRIAHASIFMGNETVANAPIQMIESNYSTPPALCTSPNSTPDTDPTQAGFNGILGVGLADADCGNGCVSNDSNGMYFSCAAGVCGGKRIIRSLQVQNPVSTLASDNNGILLDFPNVPIDGAASATGYMVFGFNSASISSKKVHYTDSSGNMTTIFTPAGTNAITSFIDSGSNIFEFPGPTNGQLTKCAGTDIFCPSARQSFTALNKSALGSTSSCVAFSIGDAGNLSASLFVYSDLGVDAASGLLAGFFDWGLPFFLGRKVFVGIENKTVSGSSPSVTGPFWAY